MLKKRSKKVNVLYVRLHDKHEDFINDLKKRYNMSKTDIIEHALDYFIEHERNSKKRTRKRG